MFRTSGISRRRPDPPVLLPDHGRHVQGFVTGITPEFFPDSLVHVFSKCFGKPVGQYLYHDCIIIVHFLFKTPKPIPPRQARQSPRNNQYNRLSPNPRGNKICQAKIREHGFLFCWLRRNLKTVKTFERCSSYRPPHHPQ